LPGLATHRGEGALLTSDRRIGAWRASTTQRPHALPSIPRHGFAGFLISIRL
jgi:hypothetical protein